uniref:Protein phosphatase 1H-like n=1 Tax=Petromyzon marinus TaxID=7757 RepID=A0AAJ7TWQ1_PETMA|nr:protein phosphatase 1H-like [Petromyzon marinus]
MLSSLQEHVSRMAAQYLHRSGTRSPRAGTGVEPGPGDRAEPGREGKPAGQGLRDQSRPDCEALPQRYPSSRPAFVLSTEQQQDPQRQQRRTRQEGEEETQQVELWKALRRQRQQQQAEEQCQHLGGQRQERQQEEQEQQPPHGEQQRELHEQQQQQQQQETQPDGCSVVRAVRPGAAGLPWGCGYAEATNHNKSRCNEDQAACLMLPLEWPPTACTDGPLHTSSQLGSQAAAGVVTALLDKAEALLPPGRVCHQPPDAELLLHEDFEMVSHDALGSGVDRHSKTPRNISNEDVENSGTVVLENRRGAAVSSFTGAVGEALPYWALFDGHGGPAVALTAAHTLHNLLGRALQKVAPVLAAEGPAPFVIAAPNAPQAPAEPARPRQGRAVSRGEIVVGAIESAFLEMDRQIERERVSFDLRGGCTAMAALCALGHLYVANAGDSRAIIVRARDVIPMSHEFTPTTERQRLQRLASERPELLKEIFTPLEFGCRVLRRDLGMRVLYRSHHMTGWGYKTATEEDLRFPLISGMGKQARLFSTIGVTRGFGNHDLMVHDTDICIKPFLSSTPEVMVHKLWQGGPGDEEDDDEVLVMGTDGLWDVLGVDEVASHVRSVLKASRPHDPGRFTRAAVALVRLATRPQGSPDDVSVFVIPLRPPRLACSRPGPPSPGPPTRALQPEQGGLPS